MICHSEASMPTGKNKSIGILSFSPDEKVYTYYGVDNTRMAMTSVPKGTLKGDTWTYYEHGTMGGKKYTCESSSNSSLQHPTASRWT